MSDSSEDEDLSRFKDAVDNSFMKMLCTSNNVSDVKENSKSERYLEEASHYNDVKVSKELQKRIGTKVSAVIEKKIKFVDVEYDECHEPEIVGGVKLFTDSSGFLSCEGLKDTYTELHNSKSRKLKTNKRKIMDDDEVKTEDCKIKDAAISGDYVMSKEETKTWKSRRKEKLFRYKSSKNSKVLTLVDKVG